MLDQTVDTYIISEHHFPHAYGGPDQTRFVFLGNIDNADTMFIVVDSDDAEKFKELLKNR